LVQRVGSLPLPAGRFASPVRSKPSGIYENPNLTRAKRTGVAKDWGFLFFLTPTLSEEK
jgi:hypothetical protein